MNDKKKAAASVLVGGAGGAVTSATVGGMGLAIGGGAISIGMAPLVIAGGIVGLAGFGLSKALKKSK